MPLHRPLALALALALGAASPRAGAAEPATATAPTASARAGVVELVLDGVDGEQRQAVLAALDIAQYTGRQTIGSARLQRLLREAPGEVAEALEVFGYYDAKARVAAEPLPERRHRVRIEVDRGEPVRIATSAVRVDGPGGDEPTVRRRLERFHPGPGTVLDHRVYEAGKAGLDRSLQRLGYFDARLVRHRVTVQRAERSAVLELAWDSGPRYRYGAVRFEGAQFGDGFLHRFVPWREDEPYDQDHIELLQQRLAASGYFASIEIEPLLEARADGRLPVRIGLQPAPRTAWTAGASYETRYGAGVRLGVDRRWLNGAGHLARGELEWAQRLQSATLEYRIPHPRLVGVQWLAGLQGRVEETDSVDNRSALLTAGLVGQWNDWTGSASLNALRGSFRVGARSVVPERLDATVVYPEVGLTRVFARDRIRPKRGGSLSFTARAASESAGSDVDLLQLRVAGRAVLPAGEAARWLGRLELGWTDTDRFATLPPELRFFAGGEGSVRGYAWQSLGPRDAAGEPIGARRLATASIEYERSFRPDWSWAVFADGGNVFEGGDVDPALGAGLGLRWSSPIGPIRIDLAHGFDNDDDVVQLHFSAGPDL
jgi:translocation and assembly module TamA